MILVNKGCHYLFRKFGWFVRKIFNRCEPGLVYFDNFLVYFGWVVHYVIAPVCAILFMHLAITVDIQN